MAGITLSISDVVHHVASIGLDIYPPIEMRDERTRLNMFFEDAREQCNDVYEQLTAGESEFKISKLFGKEPHVRGQVIPVDTFVLTQRGPVFRFPLRLADPVGSTNLESRFRDIFNAVCKILWSRLPGHAILRAGLIQDILFSTGNTDCAFLLSNETEWCGSKLVGGSRLFSYRDDKCNIGLQLSPGSLSKTTQLPVGATVNQSVGFGLKVRLDVNNAFNNAEVRPLQDADINEVIERAVSFWPTELLQYMGRLHP